jgi:hypothetical protein
MLVASMVEVIAVANIIQVSTLIISVASIGTFVWKMGLWVNKRADIKADQVRQHLDQTAIEDRKGREQIAAVIRTEAEERDTKLRAFSKDLVGQVKDSAEKDNTELLIKLGTLEDRVNTRIEKVDNKVMDMLTSLSKRSDLVNGNIANIRADIADLQEDFAEALYQDETPANTKARTRAMRIKRRRIEADRVAQAEG